MRKIPNHHGVVCYVGLVHFHNRSVHILEEAKKLIDDSGLKVESVILLQEAADKVTELLA